MGNVMIKHETTGYLVNPETGVVLGRNGNPISALVNGYYCASPRVNGVKKTYYVHRIVWEAARGGIPHGLQINHKNGVKLDTRLPCAMRELEKLGSE